MLNKVLRYKNNNNKSACMNVCDWLVVKSVLSNQVK